MKKAFVIYVLFVAFVFVLAFFRATGFHFGAPPSYIAFTFHRSQKYYSQFADACEELMAKIGTNQYRMKSDDPHLPDFLQGTNAADSGFTNVYEMAGDDPRLPIPLREVKASTIAVSTNRVWMYFNILGEYAVDWKRDYVNSNAMVLTVYGEADPQRVFLRTNDAPRSVIRTQ